MPEEWSVERAERYLTALPVGARLFAVLVTDGGSVAAADLHIRLISVRGVREGWWLKSIPEPITAVYDPADPHRHRAIAYEIAPEHRTAFHQALARMRHLEDVPAHSTTETR